ncbi:MAG: cytochrome c3 family protein, partial [Fidelibacterota bacterium]
MGPQVLALVLLLFTTSSGQTVNFDHTLHVEDLELSCNKCHKNKLIKRSLHASDNLLPEEETCTRKCHGIWREENECDICHAGNPPYQTFPARQVNFDFSHKIHAVDQRIACETCHGLFEAEGTRPKIPVMNDCIVCHVKAVARTSCVTCHEHPEDLRPASHTPFWLTGHKSRALEQSEDCLVCHTQSGCDNCHSGGVLSRDNLSFTNPYPSYRPDDSQSTLALIRNHDLNYEYFHGLDAKSQSRDCQVCHATEFCTDCHQNQDDVLLNKPDFHGGLDWGAVKYPPGT